VEDSKAELYGEVRANFKDFLNAREPRKTVLLLVWTNQRSSQLDGGQW